MRKKMGYGLGLLLLVLVGHTPFFLVSQSASQGERPRGIEDVTWTWQLVQSGIFWPEDDPTFPIAVTFDQEFQGTAFYCSRTITGTLEQSGKEYDFGFLGGSEPAFVVTAEEMEEGMK